MHLQAVGPPRILYLIAFKQTAVQSTAIVGVGQWCRLCYIVTYTEIDTMCDLTDSNFEDL